jgi:hypothetical protein
MVDISSGAVQKAVHQSAALRFPDNHAEIGPDWRPRGTYRAQNGDEAHRNRTKYWTKYWKFRPTKWKSAYILGIWSEKVQPVQGPMNRERALARPCAPFG